MSPETFTTLVYGLQVTVSAALIFLGGLSSCLSLWVIPLTELLPPSLAIRQFRQTFIWGGQYLLPTSRTLGASLLFTSFLTSRLPSSQESEKWKAWAVLFFVLILVAPYEIWFIFPINDRADEIGEVLEKGVSEAEAKALGEELRGLLGKWRRRNFGRVLWPLLVGVGGFLTIGKA